jgi:hypothetical protein
MMTRVAKLRGSTMMLHGFMPRNVMMLLRFVLGLHQRFAFAVPHHLAMAHAAAPAHRLFARMFDLAMRMRRCVMRVRGPMMDMRCSMVRA